MKKTFTQWGFIIFAVVIFMLAIFYSSVQIAAQADKPMPIKTDESPRPSVSVIEVSADSYAAQVSGYGQLTPHFNLSLTAQVSGQIDQISANFEVGRTVKQGDWLVKLENSDYQAAVKQAEQNLATEQLNFLEEQRQSVQAKSEWLSSGIKGEPDSELVLRKPQLAAAQARLDYAKSALASAQKNIRQTIITAPFDALVIARSVALGTYLQTGNDVAILYSSDRLEVAVPLSNHDWAMLAEASKLSAQPATLKNVENDLTWQGYVLRAEQHVDTESRQRALIIAIDAPLSQTPQAFSGTFVAMTLQGKNVDNVWKLPNSALSQRGEIWYVKADNTLAKFNAKPLFAQQGAIFISAPDALIEQTQSVVIHPLNNYLEGMYVAAIMETARGE